MTPSSIRPLVASVTLALAGACAAKESARSRGAVPDATPAQRGDPPLAKRVEPPAPDSSEPPDDERLSDDTLAVDLEVSPLTLTPALLRDGPLHLMPRSGGASLVVDGDPRPLTLDVDALARGHSDASAIRRADTDEFIPIALAELPDGGALLSSLLRLPRTGAYDEVVYRRLDGRWREQPQSDPTVVEHYLSFVARDGAVFGLRFVSARQETPGGDATAGDAAREPRVKQPRGFARVAGATTAKTPEVPPEWLLLSAVSSDDGTIHGIGRPHETSGERQHPAGSWRIFEWPNGQVDPVLSPLPGARDDEEFNWASLSHGGGSPLLFGSSGYLAELGEHGWRRVDVPRLNERERGSITAGLRTPAGDLWIALARRGDEALLHRPPGADWTRVQLPELTDESPRWSYADPGWIEIVVGADAPRVDAIAWANGRVWIALDYGLMHDLWDNFVGLQREALVVTGPLTRAPLVLPPLDERWYKRALATRPGRACELRSVVLGRHDQEAILTKRSRAGLLALVEELDGYPILVYIGARSGRRELVLQFSSNSPETTRAVMRRLRALFGQSLTSDCRPRRFIRAVAKIGDRG